MESSIFNIKDVSVAPLLSFPPVRTMYALLSWKTRVLKAMRNITDLESFSQNLYIKRHDNLVINPLAISYMSGISCS